MITIDIILISIIFLFMLLGKYDGMYVQINRCVALIISIFISKTILNYLIPIFIPYLGLSVHTKIIALYTSIIFLYLACKFIINMILFRYEPSQKNKNTQTILGGLLGILNGVIILTLTLSIIFYSFPINSQLLSKLNKSKTFKYIHNLNIILFNHGK